MLVRTLRCSYKGLPQAQVRENIKPLCTEAVLKAQAKVCANPRGPGSLSDRKTEEAPINFFLLFKILFLTLTLMFRV